MGVPGLEIASGGHHRKCDGRICAEFYIYRFNLIAYSMHIVRMLHRITVDKNNGEYFTKIKFILLYPYA